MERWKVIGNRSRVPQPVSCENCKERFWAVRPLSSDGVTCRRIYHFTFDSLCRPFHVAQLIDLLPKYQFLVRLLYRTFHGSAGVDFGSAGHGGFTRDFRPSFREICNLFLSSLVMCQWQELGQQMFSSLHHVDDCPTIYKTFIYLLEWLEKGQHIGNLLNRHVAQQ